MKTILLLCLIQCAMTGALLAEDADEHPLHGKIEAKICGSSSNISPASRGNEFVSSTRARLTIMGS